MHIEQKPITRFAQTVYLPVCNPLSVTSLCWSSESDPADSVRCWLLIDPLPSDEVGADWEDPKLEAEGWNTTSSSGSSPSVLSSEEGWNWR